MRHPHYAHTFVAHIFLPALIGNLLDDDRPVLVKASPADIRKVCVTGCTQKAPHLLCFLTRRPTNTPQRRRLADGQLSSLCPPSPRFTSFGAASDVVLFPPSCLFEHTLTAVCVMPEYRSGRYFKILSDILSPSKCSLYFRPELYLFEVRLELYGANAAPS